MSSDQSNTEKSISLTQEDFMMWNVESSLNLVQPFLDLTFEVCHIVFGLSPQCKHMEYDIGIISISLIIRVIILVIFQWKGGLLEKKNVAIALDSFGI